MKKILFTLCIALIATSALAQDDTKGKTSFFKDIKYDFSFGMGTKVAGEPFNHNNSITLNFGVDAIKPILTSKNSKTELAGLVGIHLVNKGGTTSDDFMTLLDDDSHLGLLQLSVPIHAVGTYYFKKCSLYFETGPFIAFTVGCNDLEGLDSNPIDVGWGFVVGLRFKRFAISCGGDVSFLNIATYKDESVYGGFAGYLLDLHWYIGGKKKNK